MIINRTTFPFGIIRVRNDRFQGRSTWPCRTGRAAFVRVHGVSGTFLRTGNEIVRPRQSCVRPPKSVSYWIVSVITGTETGDPLHGFDNSAVSCYTRLDRSPRVRWHLLLYVPLPSEVENVHGSAPLVLNVIEEFRGVLLESLSRNLQSACTRSFPAYFPLYYDM